MKYIILLLIGLATVNVLPLDKEVSIKNQTKESSVEAVSEPKKDKTVKEPTKKENAPEWSKLSSSEKIKANPSKCNLEKEIILASDGSCKKKPVTKPKNSPSSPSSTARSGDCSLVNKYDSWDKNVAYAVCMAESSGDSSNSNYNDVHRNADGSVRCIGSFGLMQLACFWISNPYDAEANMRKANEIYNSSGWSPWGAYTSGKYLKYL